MPKPMFHTVPSEFAWVIEDAIAHALQTVQQYQNDPNLPGFLRQQRDGVTLVCVLRDAEGMGGVKVSSLIDARRTAQEKVA